MNHRSLLGVLASGLFVLGLLLTWQLRESHDSAVQHAIGNADNLAQALQGQFTATLRRLDANLQSLAAELPQAALRREAAERSRVQVEALLRRYTHNFPDVGAYFVWDAEGRHLYNSSGMPVQPERSSIAQRRGYQQLRSDPGARITFSDAIRGIVTGQQSIALYVPVRDAQGRMLAVLTATLDLERISQGIDQLRIPEGSVVFMRRSDDHKLVVRHPSKESELNKPVRNAIQQRIDGGEMAGRDRFQAVTDGEYRLYGFRKLEGYPFYIVVGLAERGALVAWRKNAIVVASVMVLMGLALGLALWHLSRIEQQREAARREAQRAHALLQEAIDSISAGIVIYDPQDRLVTCNRAQRALFRDMDELFSSPGRTFEDLTHEGLRRGLFPEAGDAPQAWVADRLHQHRAADGVPHELALGDGRWLQFSEHRTPQGYTVGTRIDITERKRLEVELRELASTDVLTGLPNRRQFMQRLESEIERVRRGTTREACVLMLDLDHFKRVNDRHGHAVGDSLLRHFARLLGEELRTTDTAGRMGGEEFAVILPGSSLGAAQTFAQRLCDRLASQPLTVDAARVEATVSIGIAAIAGDDLTPDAVLSRADEALYRAKTEGRNRVQLAGASA
ncbi:MAG: diguanylate cyclase [Hylemonella sp.]|jgi:diguanylate cyclase (GGDEF)-like protein|uniref:sensor domain-containing diguanylate cyclase n=1 Tax=Hylemonella sp. TaxID=2066020 RepID=UPI00391B8602